MTQFASLSVQLGPIAGHAEGVFAMMILLAMIVVYVLGPAIAAELVRRISRREE